jgi:hypothetical protein
MPWWEPPLASHHPGYFKVVIALITTHLALSVDSLFVPESSPGFAIMRQLLGHSLVPLCIMHFITGMLMLVGLYWPGNFWLLRLGAALSAAVFNLMAAGFVASAVILHISLFAAIMCVAMSLSSVAAAKEPVDGPGGANLP